MLWKKKLIIPLILVLLTLSLVSTISTATQISSANMQTKTVSDSPNVVPPEMKFMKETDLLQSTSKIIYVWCYTEFGYFDVFVYSEEYDEATGTYYYLLSDVGKTDVGTWQVKWQIVLNTSIVWGRVADIDGDYTPEVITIPSTENLTIIYDDDGTQLMNFTMPELDRALVVVDWTGDDVNDVVLIEGRGTSLELYVFDIYNGQWNFSTVLLPDYFYVGDAFVGDWGLSSLGVEIAVLESSAYYGDSASMIVLTHQNITMIDLPYGTTFRSDIALSYEYMAFGFYDSTTGRDGVAAFHNGSILWYYQLPYYVEGLQIAELDGDDDPELIVMTSYNVRIFDIEVTPAKATISTKWLYPFTWPLDLDYDGICEVLLFQNSSLWYIGEPFSGWFEIPRWDPDTYWKPVLLNSTTLNIVSNITLPEELNFVFLPSIDHEEFLGVSTLSSHTLSIYKFKEAVPPVVDIVSPSDGSYIGPEVATNYVHVNVSAYDEHSGIYNIKLLVNNSLVDTLAYLLDTYTIEYYTLYWNVENYVDGKYNLTVVVCDNANNIASKSITVYLDKTPPVLGMVRPANKSWVSNIVNISVSVSDDGSGVGYVAFYTSELPPILLYNDTGEPYEYSWDTQLYAEGVQHLTVYVVDRVGNYQCLTLEYYVDNTAPSVEITSPKVGEYVRGVINITVSAEDSRSGIEKVSFILDGNILLNDTIAPYEYSFDSTLYLDGSHNLTVVAYDNAGNIKSTSVAFYVDNTPPTISMVYCPDEVEEGKDVVVNATVIDVTSGVSEVILSYSVDGGETWTNVTMNLKEENIYEAVIPGQPANITVKFRIIVSDSAGNIAVSQIYSYEVVSEVAPPEEEQPPPAAPGVSWTLIIGIGVVVAVAAVVVFMIVRKRK